MINILEFTVWVQQHIGNGFYSEENPYFLKYFHLYGPLRLNTKKRKVYECESDKSMICFDAYSNENFKEDIGESDY